MNQEVKNDIEELVELYSNGVIFARDVVYFVCNKLTEDNVAQLVQSVPETFVRTFWECVDSAPATEEGWSEFCLIESNATAEFLDSKKANFRRGIEILRTNRAAR